MRTDQLQLVEKGRLSNQPGLNSPLHHLGSENVAAEPEEAQKEIEVTRWTGYHN